MKATTPWSGDRFLRMLRPDKRIIGLKMGELSVRDLYSLNGTGRNGCFASLVRLDGLVAQTLLRRLRELHPRSYPGDNVRDVREGYAIPQFTLVNV